ncbi:MAG: hypothetical protein MJ162_04650 [Treponema sp.]|nr:hypothetical protein [Treponema sp.]
MKKLLLVLGMLITITSSCFAGIVIRSDLNGPGMWGYYDKNCFLEEPVQSDIRFGLYGLGGCSLLWEFNSSELKPLHFYTGIDTGIKLIGLEVSALGGLNYRICDFNKLALELDANMGLGYLEGIKGGSYLFLQGSLDVDLLGSRRKGFFGGAGVFFNAIPELNFYKNYGSNFSLDGIVGLKVSFGFRF